MTLVLCVVLVALAFEYVNGFHDTANAIATSVSTKVMTPAQAIVLSACGNLIGALMGVAVAKTVGQGLVETNAVNAVTILSALLSAITWNLVTWAVGLPSSSSHALFGGLCGAALASAHGDWHVIKWTSGLIPKVIKPMFLAPMCGILVGFLLMGLLLWIVRKARPGKVNWLFGKLQLASAAWMSYEHGRNDAQKTMGIIALTLFAATTQSNAFTELPSFLGFLRTEHFEIALWVKVVCAFTIAAGTAGGGWRIIRTLGKRVVKMQPIHGFGAQATAAAVIGMATHWGMPLSTTHVISGSIMGVGSTKRFNAVRWSLAERMVWAWLLTLPTTGFLAYILQRATQLMGLAP